MEFSLRDFAIGAFQLISKAWCLLSKTQRAPLTITGSSCTPSSVPTSSNDDDDFSSTYATCSSGETYSPPSYSSRRKRGYRPSCIHCKKQYEYYGRDENQWIFCLNCIDTFLGGVDTPFCEYCSSAIKKQSGGKKLEHEELRTIAITLEQCRNNYLDWKRRASGSSVAAEMLLYLNCIHCKKQYGYYDRDENQWIFCPNCMETYLVVDTALCEYCSVDKQGGQEIEHEQLHTIARKLEKRRDKYLDWKERDGGSYSAPPKRRRRLNFR